MTNELKVTMMNILGGMDAVIREYGDEEILEPWLMGGVPDCATEDDLDYIASDWREFRDVCACFCRRLNQIVREEERE